MPDLFDTISSASNPVVKTLRSLERKKGRSETGLFLAEGVRLVSQGLERGWRLGVLMVGTGALERDYVRTLAQDAADAGARVLAAPEHLMGRITRKDNPQAVLGAFHQRAPGLDALPSQGPARLLALYEVRDPGNLGTLLRTADCAAMDGVILVGPCCDPYSVEAVRASMGSIFDVVPVAAGWDAARHWFETTGCEIVAASMNGTVRHDVAAYRTRSVILMGNEQAGLPEPVEAACDHLVRIPMRGGADSLNLAQAAAVMVYEAWRQGDFT
ncbi:MAG: RNA methyltransferase [Pseudomonadota bacterium]